MMNERDKRKLATIEARFCLRIEELQAKLARLESLVFGDEVREAMLDTLISLSDEYFTAKFVIEAFQQAIKEGVGEK